MNGDAIKNNITKLNITHNNKPVKNAKIV